MNTPSNTQTNQIPTLAALIGFDLPSIKMVVLNEKEIGYIASCTESELDFLKSAVMNSETMLHNGIAAVMDLLIKIEIHCPEEADRYSRINALSLVHDLSLVLGVVSDTAWVLELVTATKQQA